MILFACIIDQEGSTKQNEKIFSKLPLEGAEGNTHKEQQGKEKTWHFLVMWRNHHIWWCLWRGCLKSPYLVFWRLKWLCTKVTSEGTWDLSKMWHIRKLQEEKALDFVRNKLVSYFWVNSLGAFYLTSLNFSFLTVALTVVSTSCRVLKIQ